MPRIIWFALGAIAGGAYATRLIEDSRLDRPLGAGDIEIHNPPVEKKEKGNAKEKIAGMIDDRVDQLAHLISQRGDQLADLVEARGHALADRLRAEREPGIGRPQKMGVHRAGPVAAGKQLTEPQTNPDQIPSVRVSPYGTPVARPETDPRSMEFQRGLEELR